MEPNPDTLQAQAVQPELPAQPAEQAQQAQPAAQPETDAQQTQQSHTEPITQGSQTRFANGESADARIKSEEEQGSSVQAANAPSLALTYADTESATTTAYANTAAAATATDGTATTAVDSVDAAAAMTATTAAPKAADEYHTDSTESNPTSPQYPLVISDDEIDEYPDSTPILCTIPECDEHVDSIDMLAKHLKVAHRFVWDQAVQENGANGTTKRQFPASEPAIVGGGKLEKYSDALADDAMTGAGETDPHAEGIALKRRLIWALQLKAELDEEYEQVKRVKISNWLKKEALLDKVLTKQLGDDAGNLTVFS